MDRNGIHAADGTSSWIQGFHCQTGSLTMVDGNLTLPVDATRIRQSIAEPAVYVDPEAGDLTRDLGASSGHLLLKQNRWVFALDVRDSAYIRRHPLFGRYYSGGHETFRGMGDDILISSTEDVEYAIRWGGHAALGEMTYIQDDTINGVLCHRYDLSPPDSNQTYQLPAQVNAEPGILRWPFWFGHRDTDPVTGAESITWQVMKYLYAYGTNAAKDTITSVWFAIFTNNLATKAAQNVYCLVDAESLGLPQPAKPTLAAAAGSLPAGIYSYFLRYVSSTRATAGLPSPNSYITLDAPGGVTVSLPGAQGLPISAEQVEVYRNTYTGGAWGTWNLVHVHELREEVVGGLDWWSNAAATTWTDDGVADGDPLPTNAYYNAAPSHLQNVRYYNGRLWGVDPAKPNTIRFSSMGRMDAWPEAIVDVTNVSTATLWEGGSIEVGSSARIVALQPEGGDYGQTGTVGDNLLILKENSAYRLLGSNWDDFRLVELFPMGCRASRAVCSLPGATAFVGSHDMLALTQGSSSASVISRPIYPNGISDIPATAGYWTMYLWRNTLLVQTYDHGVVGYDLASKCWTVIHDDDARLENLALVDAGSFGYSLMGIAGSNLVVVQGDGTVATEFSYLSREDICSEKPSDMARIKQLQRLAFGVRNTTGSEIPLTVSLYRDGETAIEGQNIIHVTVPATAAGARDLQVVQCEVPLDWKPFTFRTLQVGVTGSATNGVSNKFVIEWMHGNYEPGTVLK